MHTTLISFLGNSRTKGDYQKVQYMYRGQLQEPVTYIGYLLQKLIKPKRFLILGTANSMWDHLFESDLNLAGALESERLELMEFVESKKEVSQEQLNQLAPLLSKTLDTEVILKIIPAARTEEEQVAILGFIYEALADIEQGGLFLDVTHGFRTLPMISFAAIQYLNAVRPTIEVKNIFYAELSSVKQKKIGYIHELTGFINLNRWNQAFLHSEATGDYSQIAALLSEKKELAELISKASFLESIHQIGSARGKYKKAREILKQVNFMGPAALFKPILLERTDWVEETYYYQRQSLQVKKFFESGDYFRATLYGYEAYLTKKMQNSTEYNKKIDDSKKRMEFAEQLRKDTQFLRTPEGHSFQFLRVLRNALAHGEQSTRKEIQSAVHDSKELAKKLEETLRILKIIF